MAYISELGQHGDLILDSTPMFSTTPSNTSGMVSYNIVRTFLSEIQYGYRRHVGMRKKIIISRKPLDIESSFLVPPAFFQSRTINIA